MAEKGGGEGGHDGDGGCLFWGVVVVVGTIGLTIPRLFESGGAIPSALVMGLAFLIALPFSKK
jgi:hypothetical protein